VTGETGEALVAAGGAWGTGRVAAVGVGARTGSTRGGGGGGFGASAGLTGAAADSNLGGELAAASPSRCTANTALQTLQRARTPPAGTLAGSTR
jgi:hypothetical protein